MVCNIDKLPKNSGKKINDSILAKTQAEVKAMDAGGSEKKAKPVVRKTKKAAKKKAAKKQPETPVPDVSESPATGEVALHWVGQPEDGCPPNAWTRPALIVLTVGVKLLSKSEWKAEIKKIGEMCRSCHSPVPPMAVVCKDFAARIRADSCGTIRCPPHLRGHGQGREDHQQLGSSSRQEHHLAADQASRGARVHHQAGFSDDNVGVPTPPRDDP